MSSAAILECHSKPTNAHTVQQASKGRVHPNMAECFTAGHDIQTTLSIPWR